MPFVFRIRPIQPGDPRLGRVSIITSGFMKAPRSSSGAAQKPSPEPALPEPKQPEPELKNEAVNRTIAVPEQDAKEETLQQWLAKKRKENEAALAAGRHPKSI